LELVSGCSLLDAGCGYGHVYHQALRERGITPVGLDRSLGMLREASAGCRPVQGDLVELPFRDAAFDRVMCNNALYDAADRLAALRELRRVTRSGGRMVLTITADPHTEPLGELRSVFPGAVQHERLKELVFVADV
jgi:ubiquinone/menaquinone biosynthesis C-methylase UbiE